MSHFLTFVIGSSDLQMAMAPFHEFESTGIDNQYIQDVDITDEVKAQIAKYQEEYQDENKAFEEGLDYYGLLERQVESEEKAKLHRNGDYKYGYAITKGGELIKAVKRTNPNSKWDWFELGGRWLGFFKPKPGALVSGMRCRPGVFGNKPEHEGGVDAARVKDIDWEGMRQAARDEALARYNKVLNAFPDRTIPKLTRSWDELRDAHIAMFPGNYDGARDLWHSLPEVKAWNEATKNDDELRWLTLEQFQVPLDEYVARAGRNAISPFAIVKDGQWFERGSVGWWGMVSNEQDKDEWSAKFDELLASLDPETMIYCVDCHI